MYEMHYLPMDSWASNKSRRNEEAWFLVLVVKNHLGTTVAFERVAIFNLTSQSEAFAQHVHEGGTIGLRPEQIELIETMKRLKKMC